MNAKAKLFKLLDHPNPDKKELLHLFKEALHEKPSINRAIKQGTIVARQPVKLETDRQDMRRWLEQT